MIIGSSKQWKVFNLSVPLYSAGTDVRVYLLALKHAKQFRLFLQHLGSTCPNPIPAHEYSTAIVALVKGTKTQILFATHMHSSTPCAMSAACGISTSGTSQAN